MEILRQRDVYDVCIVGSGAGGGDGGVHPYSGRARAAMLEAGLLWDAVRDTRMLAWPYDSPRRGADPTGPMKIW